MITPPIGAFWAAMNIIRTGNVLGIKREDEYEKLERNLDELDKNLDRLHENLNFGEKKMQFGSTDKEELERRDELPEHVKTAQRVRAATSNIAGLSAQAQLAEQRIADLYEKIDRVEKLYMTLMGKMEQFERQYVAALRMQVGGGPTVRE